MFSRFLVLAALVQRANAAVCYFQETFGSGNTLSRFSDEVFEVYPNAQTRCTFTCSDVGKTVDIYLYLKYGGDADTSNNQVSGYYNSGCNLALTMTSSGYEKVLSYRIDVAAFTDLTMTCQCDRAGVDPGCFSEDMNVEVLGRDGPASISIKDLQVGDMVKSTSGYQPVYSFGHRHEMKITDFVQLHTDSDYPPLELTKEHFVFVDETSYLFGFWPQQKAVRADAVKVGDVLLLSGSSSKFSEKATVTAIDTVTKPGAYMPLTPDGTIIVNGIQASAYVSIEDQAKKVTDNLAFYGFSEQNLNQWWLSPYRMLCMGVSSKFCSSNLNMVISEEEDASLVGILKPLLLGRSYAELVNDVGFFMHHLVGIPTVLFLGFFVLVEKMFGPSMAPTALAALVTLSFWRIRQKSLNAQKLKKE